MTSTPITTADIAKGKIDDALSVREKIGYGTGDARRHRNNLPDHELSPFFSPTFWI